PNMETAVGWRCRPGGRLDMSHGFVRHIRHNQIARDAYERAVRQARGRARGRLPPAAPRPRRPDQQVYRPRRNGGSGGDTSPGSPPGDPRGPRLFCLEYEGDDGSVTAVIVHQ
ncbi:CB068 protein, partial [Ramphastos sulfuratus]|nr:CB068 protein [Ramphastos sulfuratus]